MLRWLLVSSYVFFMFFSAGRAQSGAQFTARLLHKWWPHLDPVQLKRFVFLARKTGHVLAYAVLVLLVYYAARRTKAIRLYALPVALLLPLTVAVFDERYQMGLPHRTGSWLDVCIDGIGVGLAGLAIWFRIKEEKKNKEVKKDVEDESI